MPRDTPKTQVISERQHRRSKLQRYLIRLQRRPGEDHQVLAGEDDQVLAGRVLPAPRRRT
jgi:hypothetical protein